MNKKKEAEEFSRLHPSAVVELPGELLRSGYRHSAALALK